MTDHKILRGAVVKTVLEEGGPEDGICIIEKDGEQYTLHSTELGWWLVRRESEGG